MGKFLLIIILSGFILSGCSVLMAVNQPSKKNTSILEEGTSREFVLEEFGSPAFSEMREGKKIDVFSFYEGSAKGWKAGRAVFHVIADLLTLGIWEIVGTTIEIMAKGDKLNARVFYDNEDRIISSEFFRDDFIKEESTVSPVLNE